MQLTHLSITGFRCLKELKAIPFHKLTVLIGENDVGKTAVLDALEILLSGNSFHDRDYSVTDGKKTDACSIAAEFLLEAGDTLPPDWRADSGHKLRLKRTLASSGSTYSVEGVGFVDRRWSTFDSQTAGEQEALLTSIGVPPGKNKTLRSDQFNSAIAMDAIARESQEFAVPFAQLVPHLPRFERVSSTEYKQPESMVQRVLHAVVDSAVREADPENGGRRLIAELQPVDAKIRAALDEKATELIAVLQKTIPHLKDVKVTPVIDYSKSVTAHSLLVDTGGGLHAVSQHGEGAKKRLWMALLEWERSEQKKGTGGAVIRVYDEPDVNLDYAAERELFASIMGMASIPGSKMQIVVSTHTMTLVDRAPAESINLLVADEADNRSVKFLQTDADADVRTFLQTMSRVIGLSNSSLFYERAFLVVEGESEENAIPILYRNLYGKSLIEDGIVLVNLSSCGAWRGVLKVLLSNRQDVTIMLLDQDCQLPDSSGYITEKSLTDIGFPATFVQTSCFFVGTKEFEDAFADMDITGVLNAHWPRQDGTPWTSLALQEMRSAEKFSEELMKKVRYQSQLLTRSSAKKPEFATRLAQHCLSVEQVPIKIVAALEAARRSAGVESPDLQSSGAGAAAVARPEADDEPGGAR